MAWTVAYSNCNTVAVGASQLLLISYQVLLVIFLYGKAASQIALKSLRRSAPVRKPARERVLIECDRALRSSLQKIKQKS